MLIQSAVWILITYMSCDTCAYGKQFNSICKRQIGMFVEISPLGRAKKANMFDNIINVLCVINQMNDYEKYYFVIP